MGDNVQPENGYTTIANELLEKLSQIKLSPTQYRLILIIWRYTYGFKRKTHKLSLTFLAEAINCDKRQIQRELKELSDKKIIFQNIESGRVRLIGFNKHHSQWLNRTIGEIDNGESDNGEIDDCLNHQQTIGEIVKGTIGEIDNQEINKEKLKTKYKYSPKNLELAQYLLNWILTNKPNYKQPKTLEPWANTFRLMVDNDCRSPDVIKSVIDWCQKDSFWKINILSADTLRDKFDRLELQMNSKKVVNLNNVGTTENRSNIKTSNRDNQGAKTEYQSGGIG